ncbi:MAG: ATP-dependent DNA helicase PcrA [Gemmatimonadetes bacterium]|nr:ATP-dependent DNA helicase PcrA [Gemmatimonadota bacterium]
MGGGPRAGQADRGGDSRRTDRSRGYGLEWNSLPAKTAQPPPGDCSSEVRLPLNLSKHPSTRAAEGLNPEQRAAVEHLEGPLLVLAGAGSGKTRVLTVRIARLIQELGVPPARILAVTFTNKAAEEMRIRIRGLLGRDPTGAWIGTFHAIGARLLRRHAEALGWDVRFTIFDAEESVREVGRVMESLGVDQKRWRPKAVQAVMSDAKNQLVSPEAFSRVHEEGFQLLDRVVARVYPEYQRSLRKQNAFDFDDLLVKPVELLEGDASILARYQERFAFLLVDEYQDTNHAQFRLVEALARVHRNLMVVGDDDQSIYGWRGADIRNILDFEQTFEGARVVRLEQNYRSTGTILQAANSVIRRNLNRKGKTLRTDREQGARITVSEFANERDEAAGLTSEVQALLDSGALARYRDAAVLYRTNAQSRALEDAFRRRGIPYQIVGGVRFYERREIQDVLAYLRLISNPRDTAAFERGVNLPRRGVGQASIERLKAWCGEMEVSLLAGAARTGEISGLSAGAARGLGRFTALVQDFAERAKRLPVGPLIEELVERLDLLSLLRAEGPDGEERVGNVEELIAGAMDFELQLGEEVDAPALAGLTELDLFLQQVSLVSDIDRHDPESDAITLMTLHNAKGLEYPVVFISGLEEGLFPLARAYDEPTLLEEERRLFYVGITRARDRLYLSWARERRRGGSWMVGTLSSFVDDIPADLVTETRSRGLGREWGSQDVPSGRGSSTADVEWSRLGPRAGRGGASADPRVAPEREISDDLAFGAEMNQDLPDLRKGERVSHPTFGSGRVVEVTGFGRDVKVIVDFQSVGKKKLVIRYAGLEKEL